MLKKELCREFNLSYYSLRKVIKPNQKQIGNPTGLHYLPYQVEIIRNIFNTKQTRVSRHKYQEKRKKGKAIRQKRIREIPRF